MKKIVLAVLIASGLMAADSGVYLGVEYGVAKNSTTQDFDNGSATTSYEDDNNYKDIKVKIGGGRDGGVKFQGSLSFITFDEYVFSYASKETIELGFDIIKEFEVTPSVYPYIKAGFGVGFMDVEGYSEDSIAGVSFKIGAGVSFKVVDHLYLLAGIDYVGRKWQDIEYQTTTTTTISTTDSGIKPYVGVNFLF